MATENKSTQKSATVTPKDPFNAKEDAEVLHQVIKDADADKIISILAYRSNGQRQQIAKEYRTFCGKDLVNDFKSKSSGNFKNALVAMMTPPIKFYAKELHRAIRGLGTDENILIEILCTSSKRDILEIRKEYETLYKNTLEQDVIGDTSGALKRLMVSLCNADRDDSNIIDVATTKADVEALCQAGGGTEESTFNAVLCQRNWYQLQLVFHKYKEVSGHDIEEAIANKYSGDAKQGLLTIVRSIKNRPVLFAKLLNKTVKGLGTNDKDLIRLVVTRSEIDMVDIKKEYAAAYGESLADAIKGDCSGNYKHCLLHLIRDV